MQLDEVEQFALSQLFNAGDTQGEVAQAFCLKGAKTTTACTLSPGASNPQTKGRPGNFRRLDFSSSWMAKVTPPR
ncbi:hypothetical protein ACXPVS_23045 [Pseudomonas sp. Ma2-10]